jgi:threonine/homoserine/homoserine lactone efflux protein
MTDLPLFALALAAIFAVPGPTNAKLLLAGANRGFRGALPVMAATLGAYVASVALQYAFSSTVIGELTAAAQFAKLALAAYLLLIAWQTWKFEMERSVTGGEPIAARQLAAVTAVNPKTLIIAFAIFPPKLAVQDLAVHAAIFIALLVIAVSAWVLAGSLLKQLPTRSRALPLFRGLAVGLSVLSAVLTFTAFRDLVA